MENTTLAFMMLTSGGILTFVMLLFTAVQKSPRGEWYWLVANGSLTVALFVFFLRGALPQLLTVVAANWLLVASFLMLEAGLREFQSVRVPLLLHGGILSSAVPLLAAFTFVWPDVRVRVVVVSCYLCAIAAVVAFRLLRGFPYMSRRVPTFLAALFAGVSLFFAARIGVAVALPGVEDPLTGFVPGAVGDVMYVLCVGGWTFATVGFIILKNQALNWRLERSLEEKEVLLREIHHRVKNNLQVISSLFYLESSSVHNAEVRESYREMQNRIRSMVFVHDRLYQSANIAQVHFVEYMRELTRHVALSYRGESGNVTCDVGGTDAPLTADIAVPLGLIATEAVSNSLKYAFPSGRPGHVFITAEQDSDGLSVRMRDDGVGLPDDFNPEMSSGMGFKIMRALADQIGAEISIDGKAGMDIALKLKNVAT